MMRDMNIDKTNVNNGPRAANVPVPRTSQATEVSTSVQQLLQIPNDYNIRTCKKAAKIIFGEIVNTPRKRRCVKFVTEIYKQLLFLHDYNTHTAKKKKRFPFSKELVNLLVEYVRLERDVLHYPKNFSVAYKEKVTHRVITLLEIMLCGCAKPTPPGCKFPNSLLVLHLLNMVPQHSQSNELEDIFVSKIVKKLGIFNVFEDLKNGSLLDSDIGIDMSMSIAEMMCYYGIDELNEEWDSDDENDSGGFSRFKKINLDHQVGRDISKKSKKPTRVRVKPTYSVYSDTVRKKVTAVTDANSNPDLSGTVNSDVQIVIKPSVNDDVEQSTKHNPSDCKKLLPNGIKFNDSPKCLLTESDIQVQFDVLGYAPCTSRASDITCFNTDTAKVKCKQLPKLVSPINVSEVISLSDDDDCDLLNDASDAFAANTNYVGDKDKDEDNILDRFVDIIDLSSTKEINTNKTSISTDNQVNEISSSEAYDVDNCQSLNLQYPSPRSDTSMYLEITSTTSYTNYPTVESGNTWSSSNSPSTSQLSDNQMESVDLNDISNDQVHTSNLPLKAEQHWSELSTDVVPMTYDRDISQQCSDTNCVDAPTQNQSDAGSPYSVPFQSCSSQSEKEALQQGEFPDNQDAVNEDTEHESIENSVSRKLNEVHPDSIEKVITETTKLTGPVVCIKESPEKSLTAELTTLHAQFNSGVPEKLLDLVSIKTTETQEKDNRSDYKSIAQTIAIEIPKDIIEHDTEHAVDESHVYTKQVTDEISENKIGYKQSETVIQNFFEQAEEFLEEVSKKGHDGKIQSDKLESIKYYSSCTANIIAARTNKFEAFDEPFLPASHNKDLLTNEISKSKRIIRHTPSTADTIDVQTVEKITEEKLPVITEQSQEFVEHLLQASSDEGEVAKSPNQQLFNNSKESLTSSTSEVPVDVMVNQPTIKVSLDEHLQEYSEVVKKDVYNNTSLGKDTSVDSNIQAMKFEKDFPEVTEQSEKVYVTSKIPEKVLVEEPDFIEECVKPVTTEVVESQREGISVNQTTSEVTLEEKLLVKFEEFVEVIATTKTKEDIQEIPENSQTLETNVHHNSELSIKEVVNETAEDAFEGVGELPEEGQEEPYMHVSNYEESVSDEIGEEPIKQIKSDDPVASQTNMSVAFDEVGVEPLSHHVLYSVKSLDVTSKSEVLVQLPAKHILCLVNNTNGCISPIRNETSEDGIVDQTSTVQLLCNEHWHAVTNQLHVGQEQIPDTNKPLEQNTPIIKKLADYDNDIYEKADKSSLCLLAYTAVENMEYLPVKSSTPSTSITNKTNKQARSRVRIPSRQAYIAKKQKLPTIPTKMRRKLPPRAAKRCITYTSIDQQIRHIMELEELDKEETSETKNSAAVVYNSPCLPEIHSEDSSDRLIIDEQNLDPDVYDEDTLSDNLLLVTTNSVFVEQLKKIKNMSISAILQTIKEEPKSKTTIQNVDKRERSKSMNESTNSKHAEVSKKKKRVSFEDVFEKNQKCLNQKTNPIIDAREQSDFLEVELKLRRKEAVNKDENIKEVIKKQTQIIEKGVPVQENIRQKKNSKPRSTLKVSPQNSKKHSLARNKPCKSMDIEETAISSNKTVTIDKRISTSLKREKNNIECDLPKFQVRTEEQKGRYNCSENLTTKHSPIEDLSMKYPCAEQINEETMKKNYSHEKKTQLHGIVNVPSTCCKSESTILEKAKDIFENTCDQLLRHGTEVIPMVAGYSACHSMASVANADEEPLDLTSKQHKKSNAVVNDKIMEIVENLPHDIEITHVQCMEFSKTEKPKGGIEEREDYTNTIQQERNVILNKLLLPIEEKHILQTGQDKSNVKETHDECVNPGEIVDELEERVSDANTDSEQITIKRLHQEIMEVDNLSSTTKDLIDTENRTDILSPEKTTEPLEGTSVTDNGMDFDVEQTTPSNEQVQLVNDNIKTLEEDLPRPSKVTTNTHNRANKSLLLTKTSNEQVLDSRLKDNTIATEEDASIEAKEVTIDCTDLRESDRRTNEHRPDILLDNNICMIENALISSQEIVSEEPNFELSNADISHKHLLVGKTTNPPVEKEKLFDSNPLKEWQSPETALPISKQSTLAISEEKLNNSVTQQINEQIQVENIYEEANNINEKSLEEDMKTPPSQIINSDNIKDIDTNIKYLEKTGYVEEPIVKIPFYDADKESSTIKKTQDEQCADLEDGTPTLDNVSNFPELTVSDDDKLITTDAAKITQEEDYVCQENINKIKMFDVPCGEVNTTQQEESPNPKETEKADQNCMVENTDTSSYSDLGDQPPNIGQGDNSSTMEEDFKSNPEANDERNHEGDDLSVQSVKTKEEQVLNKVLEHSTVTLDDISNSSGSAEPDEVGVTAIDVTTITSGEVAGAILEENGNMIEESPSIESKAAFDTNQTITDNEIVSSTTSYELLVRDEVKEHADIMRGKSTITYKDCITSEDFAQIEMPTNMMQRDLQVAFEKNINDDHSSDTMKSPTRTLNDELQDVELKEQTIMMAVDTQITCKSLCQTHSNAFSIKRLLDLDDAPNKKKRHKSVMEENAKVAHNMKHDQEIKAISHEQVTDDIHDTKVMNSDVHIPCENNVNAGVFPTQTRHELEEYTNISEEGTDQKIDIAPDVTMKYNHEITTILQEVTDDVNHHTEVINDDAQIACEDIVYDNHNTAPDVNMKYDHKITAIPQEVTDDVDDNTKVIEEDAQIACENIVADDHDTAPDVNMKADYEITAIPQEEVTDDVDDNTKVIEEDAQIACENIVAIDHDTAPDVNMKYDHKITAIPQEEVTDDVDDNTKVIEEDPQIACENIVADDHDTAPDVNMKSDYEITAIRHKEVTDDVNNHSMMKDKMACENIINDEHLSNCILPTETNHEYKEHTIVSEDITDQRIEIPADVNMRYDHEIAVITHEEVTDDAVDEHIEVIKSDVKIACENNLNIEYSDCLLPTKTSRKLSNICELDTRPVLETEVREPASMMDEDLAFVSGVNVSSDSITDVTTFRTKTSNEEILDFVFEDYTNVMEEYCPSTAKATINTEDRSDFGVFCINTSSECVREDQTTIPQYDTHVTSKANVIMDIITDDDVQIRTSKQDHEVVLEDSANMQANLMMSSGASTSADCPIPMEENTSSWSETTTITSEEDDAKTELDVPKTTTEHHIWNVTDEPKPHTEDFIMEDVDIEVKEISSEDLQNPIPTELGSSTSQVMNTPGNQDAIENNALKNVDDNKENRIGYQMDCHLYYKTKDQSRVNEQHFVVPDLLLESDKAVGQHDYSPEHVSCNLAIQEVREKAETVIPDNTVDTVKTEEYNINSRATVNGNKRTNVSTSPIKLRNESEVKDHIHTVEEGTTMVKTINADSFDKSQTDLKNKDVLDVVLEDPTNMMEEHELFDIDIYSQVEIESATDYNAEATLPSFLENDMTIRESLSEPNSFAEDDDEVSERLKYYISVKIADRDKQVGGPLIGSCKKNTNKVQVSPEMSPTRQGSQMQYTDNEDGVSSFREQTCISTLMEANLDQGPSPSPDETVSVFQLSDQEHQYYNSFIGHQTPQMMQNVQCATESNTHFIDLDLHLESRSDDDIMSMMEVHRLMHPNAMANQLSPVDLPPMLTNLKQEVDTDTENNMELEGCNSSIANNSMDESIDYNVSFPGTVLPASMSTSSSTDEKKYLTNYSLSDLENISFHNDSMTPLNTETPKSTKHPAPVLKETAEPQKVEVKVNEFDYASTDDMFKNISKPDSSPKPKPIVVKKEKRLMDLVEKLSHERKQSAKVQSKEDVSLYARRKTRPEITAPIKNILPLHNESTPKLTSQIVIPINKIEKSSEVQVALPSKSTIQKSPSQLQCSENLNLNSNVDVGQVPCKEPMLNDGRPESSMHYKTALWHENDNIKVTAEEKIVLPVPSLPLLIDTPAKLRNRQVAKVAPTVRNNTKPPPTNNNIPQYDPVVPNTYDTVKTRQRNQTNKYGSDCSQTKHYQSDRGKRKSASVEHIRPAKGKSEEDKQRGDNRQRSGSLCPANEDYPKSKSVEETDPPLGKRRSRSKLDDPEALRIDKRQKKDMMYEEPSRPRSRPFSEERDRTGYALKIEPFSLDAHQKSSPLSSTKSRYTSEEHMGNVQDMVAFQTKGSPYAYDKKPKASISDKQSPTTNSKLTSGLQGSKVNIESKIDTSVYGKSHKKSSYNKPSSTPYNISNSIKHSERNSKEKDNFSPSSTDKNQRRNSSASSNSKSPTPERRPTAEELFDELRKEHVNDHKRKIDAPYLREGSLGDKKGANEQKSWPSNARPYHSKQQSYEKLNIKISQPASSSSREGSHNLRYSIRDSDGSRRNFEYTHSQNNHASTHHDNHQMRPNHNQQPSRSYHSNDKGRQLISERFREDRSHNYPHGNRHAPYGSPQKYARKHDINFHLSTFRESLKRKQNVKDNWFEELESKLVLPAAHSQLFENSVQDRKEK